MTSAIVYSMQARPAYLGSFHFASWFKHAVRVFAGNTGGLYVHSFWCPSRLAVWNFTGTDYTKIDNETMETEVRHTCTFTFNLSSPPCVAIHLGSLEHITHPFLQTEFCTCFGDSKTRLQSEGETFCLSHSIPLQVSSQLAQIFLTKCHHSCWTRTLPGRYWRYWCTTWTPPFRLLLFVFFFWSEFLWKHPQN